MNQPLRILLDTNVWLDSYLGQREGHETSMELITLAIEQGLDLLYASSSVRDIYYLFASCMKRGMRDEGIAVTEAATIVIDDMAWGCVSNMGEIATVVPLDMTDIWLAERYRSIHGDFEDNLVLAAAERAAADFLVTTDAALRTKAPLAAYMPKDMLAYLRR